MGFFLSFFFTISTKRTCLVTFQCLKSLGLTNTVKNLNIHQYMLRCWLKVNNIFLKSHQWITFLPYFQGRLFFTVKVACCSVDLLVKCTEKKIYLSSRLFSDVFLTFLPKRRHFHGHCLLCTGPKKFSHFIILWFYNSDACNNNNNNNNNDYKKLDR